MNLVLCDFPLNMMVSINTLQTCSFTNTRKSHMFVAIQSLLLSVLICHRSIWQPVNVRKTRPLKSRLNKQTSTEGLDLRADRSDGDPRGCYSQCVDVMDLMSCFLFFLKGNAFSRVNSNYRSHSEARKWCPTFFGGHNPPTAQTDELHQHHHLSSKCVYLN